MIRSMIKRLNKALPALLLGIVLYGLLVQFIGVWFVKDKLLYSTGLWIGIAMAMGMAIHIAVVIEDAIALNGENHAKNKIVAWSLLRYMIVVIIFFVTLKFRLGNVLMERQRPICSLLFIEYCMVVRGRRNRQRTVLSYNSN